LQGVSSVSNTHVLLAMLETAIFNQLFYKKQYLSNGQASCREILHKHIKQMAFHDNGYHSLFIKLF